MLLYCEKCRLAFEGDRCPVCGGRKSRTPFPNDACFLCEKQILWGEMLENVLKNNGIPVIVEKRLGAGMALKVGQMLEWVRVYVPFSRLQEAAEIEKELFSQTDGEGEA